jgi:hypothetical protein
MPLLYIGIKERAINRVQMENLSMVILGDINRPEACRSQMINDTLRLRANK